MVLPRTPLGRYSLCYDSRVFGSENLEGGPERERNPSGTLATALSFKKNLSWTFAGYAVYVFCQWGMLVVLAKLLSPTEVGRFALGLAVAAPIVLFANLGLRPLQATDAERRYTFADYLGLRILTTVPALLAIVGVVFLAGYEWETKLVVVMIGVAKCFEAVSDIFYGLLQQRERMDRFSKSIVARGLLSLAALTALVYLTGSALWGALGMALSWALVLLFYDLRSGAVILGKLPRPRWDAGTLRKMILLSFPLGVSVVLFSLNANVPRYLVEHYSNEAQLGIFAAMAYPVAAGATVVGALGQAASPRLAKYYTDGDFRAFRILLAKLAGLGAALGSAGLLVAIVAGRDLLTLVYGPEYARHLNVFLMLVAGAGIVYVTSFLGFGLIASRRLQAQVLLMVWVISVTLLACILFIPSAGILGAAAASVFSISCQLVGSVFILARATRTSGTA